MDNSTVILMKGDSPKAIKATSFIRQPINFGLSTQYSLSATISAHIFGAVMISLLFVLPIILIQALVDFESYSLTLYLKPHSRNIHMELIRWLLFFAISFAAVLAADISLSIATLFMKTFSSKKNNISFIANQLRSLRVYFLMFVFGFAASIAAQSILPFLAIKKSSEEEDYIYSWEFYFARLVLCLGFGFFFLLLEKILLRRIAFVYHRTYYRDRIDDNNFSWSVLNELAQKFHLMRDFNKMEGSSSEIENSLDKSNRFFNTGARSSDSFAKKLFEKLSKGKEEIYFSSFKEHLTKEDSIRIFKLIDVNDSSGISLEEMQSFINTLKDERDSLYRSMEDNKHIVRRLDILLLSIFFITFVLFSLSILSIQTGTYVASLGTIFLAISFIFGNVLSTLFKSILFIFLSHPFDVGDKSYIIEEIEFLATVMISLESNQKCYLPNSLLYTSKILNIRRSPNQIESVSLCFSSDTSNEKLLCLEQEIKSFCAQNQKDYGAAYLHRYELLHDGCLRCEMTFEHRSNFQDYGLYRKRHTNLKSYLYEQIERLQISHSSDFFKYTQ